MGVIMKIYYRQEFPYTNILLFLAFLFPFTYADSSDLEVLLCEYREAKNLFEDNPNKRVFAELWIKRFNEVIDDSENDPYHAYVFANLGDLYMITGEHDLAINSWQNVSENDLNDPTIRYMVLDKQISLARYLNLPSEKIISYLDILAKVIPYVRAGDEFTKQQLQIRKARISYTKGEIFEESGMYLEAEKAYLEHINHMDLLFRSDLSEEVKEELHSAEYNHFETLRRLAQVYMSHSECVEETFGEDEAKYWKEKALNLLHEMLLSDYEYGIYDRVVRCGHIRGPSMWHPVSLLLKIYREIGIPSSEYCLEATQSIPNDMSGALIVAFEIIDGAAGEPVSEEDAEGKECIYHLLAETIIKLYPNDHLSNFLYHNALLGHLRLAIWRKDRDKAIELVNDLSLLPLGEIGAKRLQYFQERLLMQQDIPVRSLPNSFNQFIQAIQTTSTETDGSLQENRRFPITFIFFGIAGVFLAAAILLYFLKRRRSSTRQV